MKEDPDELDVKEEDSCNLFMKYATNENPKNSSIEDKSDIRKAAYNSILEELIDDAILDLCFEVHREVKFGSFFLNESDIMKFRTESETNTSDSLSHCPPLEENLDCYCPLCKKKLKAPKNFTSHLTTCMKCKTSRKSFREASEKLANVDAYDNSDENDSDSEMKSTANKNKNKKGQSRNARRKPKVQGNSISKPSSNFNIWSMTPNEKKEFFDKVCGAISKRGNKLCKNSHKCSQHTDQQRRDVRRNLLRDVPDHMTDGQIDVDTVDEGNNGIFIHSYSTDYPCLP